MSDSTPRPPAQVTYASWLVVGASVVAVLMAFSEVSSLRTLDTQETIRRYLSEPPGDSLGVSVADVQSILRGAALVTAICAAVTAVLGWYVRQRSRRYRAWLTVVAVPLFLGGLASGGFATAVVAASVTMLWLQPARDWYAGIDRPAQRPGTPVPRAVAPPTPTNQPTAMPTAQPTPWMPTGGLAGLPPPTAAPYGSVPVPGPGRLAPAHRPAAVGWACAVTWLFSAIAAGALVVMALVMLADPRLILDQADQNADLARQGVSDQDIRLAVYVMAGVVVAWSLAAAVVAGLAWRRVRWAHVALLCSTGAAGLVTLLLAVSSPVLLVVVAVCVLTFYLLLRPEVRLWFASSSR